MVAPVRCATPGTDVDWATQPCASAVTTIQSHRTPPPCPPIARIAMVIGLSRSRGRAASIRAFSAKNNAAHIPPLLEIPDDGAAQTRERAVPPCRIVDHVRPIEGRAEHGGFGDLTAIATADTGIVDRRHRIVLQGVLGVLDRERRTAGQADAGV